MQPARLDLSVIQGATFRQILRVMQPELAYRSITAVASTSPVRLTVDHDLPTDWPVWVRGVTGFPALNKEFPRALPHLAQVVDAGHLDINPLAATGLLPKGGELSYYLPVDLTGAAATLKVLDAAGTELLSLAPTVHAAGWVELLLSDEQTAALTWKEGVWYLDLAFPSGESYRAATGKATVYPAGTVPSGTCESAWVLTAGGQGVPGPMGPAFQIDAFGLLAARDQYDDEAEGFAFLATDTGDLYLREGAPGGWSDGVPFQGPAGEEGRSITSVTVNGSGHLIITYSDGTTSDAGAIPAAPTVWGAIGGTLLDQVDLADGLNTKVDKVAGKGLSTEDYSTAEKSKLSGIASGATANASDAQLRDRATHTGTQLAATISDFSEALDDRVATFLVPGTNITLVYDDVAGTLTISSSGGGGGGAVDSVNGQTGVVVLDAADVGADPAGAASTAVGDHIGASDPHPQYLTPTEGNAAYAPLSHAGAGGSAHAVVVADGAAGFMSGADKTKLDGVATGATANDTDGNLKSRANHTGTQSASTISDLTEAVQDIVGGFLVQGSNITLTYNDAANTLTIAAAGGGGTAGDLLASLVNSEVSVTGATTLTATAFGKMHVCSGASAYTVGLPAVSGNAGKLIGLRGATTLTGLITVDPNASELVDGVATTTLMASEVLLLLCDGTGWVALVNKRLSVRCSAAKTATQSIAGAAFTKITFGSEEFDEGSGFDLPNSRFIAPRAGDYQLNANATFLTTAVNDIFMLRFYKNGTAVRHAGYVTTPVSSAFITAVGAAMIRLAAGDVIELYAYNGQGTARDVTGTAASGTTLFSAFEIPPR
ncbi:hypothetical protein E8E95_05820 [Pseudomonas sp. BN414]|uniref:hypothetical protein n=1 Tax=Pseudomonas sp. BN414 TaxID=2567888 RepID=UPI0024550CA8|nr:hypothetical protein [Pseudomonas sp. BN414]MDH4566191.1 hypothetical protein [Pseudomonas sp. BN414]